MSPITPERWQRVTSLLDAVLPYEPSQRGRLLVDLCAGDEKLRREVESLLRYEEEYVSVLDEPLAPWRPSNLDPPGLRRSAWDRSGLDTLPANQAKSEIDEVGARIGPYRVLEQLGAGGMGTVYLAAREDDFRKRVALKRINDEVMSEEVLFRFENECQIVADLEHPNIARILDAGKTRDRLPYFAMEYVDGESIDEYCNRHRLPLRQRIELVLEVCSALQVAHQNLVVHRDLKPGNILVTRDGVPKLIDFGIAKHLVPASASHDLTSHSGNQPMTLRYASPEQLRNLPITTAADIYSLGVLIYQLLTGHDPYPFDQGVVGMHRSICEHEPLVPSVAVGRSIEVRLSKNRTEQRTPESVSWARGTSPGKLRSALAGDLDSILLKALRKQPENRFRSVEQLAEDLDRHLKGLPVSACEGTFRYIAGKFVRRHRAALAVSMLLILAAVGLVIAALQQRTAAEEARINDARARAGRTVDLLEKVIEVFGPDDAGDRVTPLDFLTDTQQQITEDLGTADPELLADLLRGFVMQAYKRLGHQQQALTALEQAQEILEALHPGEDHPKLAEILVDQGATLVRLRNPKKAEVRSRAGLEMRQRLGLKGVDLTSPMVNLASSFHQQGEPEEAIRLYREVVAILRRELGPGSQESAAPLRNLGMAEFVQGRVVEARELLQESLDIELQRRGPNSLRVASLRSALGRVFHAEGWTEEAERELREALRMRRAVLESDSLDVARAERNLAALMIELGELATAEVLLGHAQQALRKQNLLLAKPDQDWEMAETESLLGEHLLAQGRFLEAETCLVESYRTIALVRGPDAIYAKQALNRVIQLYEQWGKPAEAENYRVLLEVGREW